MSHLTEEMQGRAALYVLGALSKDETDAFEQVQANAVQAADVTAFASVVTDLGYAAPVHKPSEALRSRVLNRVAQLAKQEAEAAPFIKKSGFRFAH